MKRIVLMLAVVGLVAGMGLAKDKPAKGPKDGKKGTPPTLTGKITAAVPAVEDTPGSITIEPRKKKGGEAVGPQTIEVAAGAKIIVNRKPGSLDDIKALLTDEKVLYGAVWVKDDKAARVMAMERKPRGPKGDKDKKKKKDKDPK